MVTGQRKSRHPKVHGGMGATCGLHAGEAQLGFGKGPRAGDLLLGTHQRHHKSGFRIWPHPVGLD